MEAIIQTIGIAVASALGLVILFIIVCSQWNIFRRERQQEKQHIYNK